MENPENPALVLLNDPVTNQGVAFDEAQRSKFGLRGLLPFAIDDIDEQVARADAEFGREPTDLGQHINLRALQDTNETVFYRLVGEHVEEMLPIVYTRPLARHVSSSAIFTAARGACSFTTRIGNASPRFCATDRGAMWT